MLGGRTSRDNGQNQIVRSGNYRCSSFRVTSGKITTTHTQTTYSNHIAGKKGAHPAEVRALAPVFEKSATEFKLKQKLLKCKSTIQITTFNVRTLNRIGQLPDQTASAIDHNIDIICVQEHRYLHSEDLKHHDPGNECTFVSASA